VGISNPSTKLTIKSTYNNEDSGLCLDASDGNVYHLKLYPYVVTGGQVGYKFRVGNQALTTTEPLFITKDYIYITNLLTERFNFKTNLWHISTDNRERFWFSGDFKTIYRGYGSGNLASHEFRGSDDTIKMLIADNGNVTINGRLNVALFSVNFVGYDDVGVDDVSGTGQTNQRTLFQIWNSFTAFHRCFTDDELFNNDNPQEFKDDYMGRIVVSTGTIKTHSSKVKPEGDTEWEIKTGKEAIVIEDAHPTIELSRKKKDKRVFGVLGLNTRKNSSPERLIINSIGEGGIWVCNSNGNIENGDYITSSDYLGYGEKQDDDLLHNYTVAKATMNCDFILDSPYYKCLELNDNIKIAFIACTYHCG
jgi:hypothetical protein